MVLKPLSPTNDFVFKKVFGGNLKVLEDFLKAVLDLPTVGQLDAIFQRQNGGGLYDHSANKSCDQRSMGND